MSQLHIIKVSEGLEKDYGAERVFKEIMVENTPKFGKLSDINIQIKRS